jgi:DHA1 family tetracycline resistance protein-like MFS transporter
LLLSQAGTLVSWLVFLVAFALPRTEILRFDSAACGGFVLTLPLVVLIAARALDGLTGGNVSVANAYLADVRSAGRAMVKWWSPRIWASFSDRP